MSCFVVVVVVLRYYDWNASTGIVSYNVKDLLLTLAWRGFSFYMLLFKDPGGKVMLYGAYQKHTEHVISPAVK